MKLFARLTDLPDNHPDIINDIQKRYSSTYVNYNGKAVFVHSPRTTGVNLQFVNGDECSISLDAPDTNQISIITPKTGYYNVNGNPIYITKTPERQWKRSFGKHIYKIYSPMYNKDLIATPSVWFQAAQEIIQPEYAKLKDISNALFANVALSRDFVVTAINKVPYLGYKRYPVATLDFKYRHIKVLQPLLKQEIKDMLVRNGEITWDLR